MKKLTFVNRKAELSLTVIVSAVLALVVLIVLIYIFMNGVKKPQESFASCGLSGGECRNTCADTEHPDSYEISGSSKACSDNPNSGGSLCCTRKFI